LAVILFHYNSLSLFFNNGFGAICGFVAARDFDVTRSFVIARDTVFLQRVILPYPTASRYCQGNENIRPAMGRVYEVTIIMKR
jgi:hypothetical protein